MSEQESGRGREKPGAITGSVPPSGEVPFSEVRKGLQLVSTNEPQPTPLPEPSASAEGNEPTPSDFED
jgi:hypothetical protein